MNLFNVRDFGALGNGVADDTQAIQNTIARCQTGGGGTVYLPAGVYRASALLMTNVEFCGDGRMATKLRALDATSDLLTIVGGWCHIHHLGFDSAVPRTSGAYVLFGDGGGESTLDQFHMLGAFIGVHIRGTTIHVENGTIRDNNQAPGPNCCILIDGDGNDQYIRCVTTDHPADKQPLAGIYVRSTGSLNITDCGLIHSGNDLLVTGGYSIYAINTFFDTALCGVRILATGGPVQRCHFLGCWTSSHTEHGFLIEPDSPHSVDTIEIIGHQSCFNGFSGVYLGAGNNIKLVGSTIAENKDTGLVITGSSQHVMVSGNKIGSTASMKGNRLGCVLASSADYVILTSNDLLGNLTPQGNLRGSCPHLLLGNNFS